MAIDYPATVVGSVREVRMLMSAHNALHRAINELLIIAPYEGVGGEDMDTIGLSLATGWKRGVTWANVINCGSKSLYIDHLIVI